MPTKRRRIAPTRHRTISPEAIAAWKAGNYWTLHHALGLPVWMMPDWGQDPPEKSWMVQPLPQGKRYPDPAEIQAWLIANVGPPPKRWRMR